jgi:hypothetical protein
MKEAGRDLSRTRDPAAPHKTLLQPDEYSGYWFEIVAVVPSNLVK